MPAASPLSSASTPWAMDARAWAVPALGLQPRGCQPAAGAGGAGGGLQAELWERHGIVFDRLYVLANMPIRRFGSALMTRGQFADYLDLLKANYCPANLAQVMCRDLISVDWQGRLFDCDFNQQLGLALRVGGDGGAEPHLRDLLRTDLAAAPIAVADHCYGCTAGQGSSCGGALADPAQAAVP